MAGEIILVRINELQEMLTTEFTNSYLALSNGLESYKLELEQLRQDILNNAALTGNPSVPTPNENDNSQSIANTEYVQTELAGLGLNPATSVEYGTVRTAADTPVPTVYLVQQIDALLAAINAALDAQADDISALDDRLDTYDALNVSSRLTTAESRLNGIDTLNGTQDGRLSAVESLNTTQNTRLTSVEGVNSTQNSRLTSLEVARNELQALHGLVQGYWSSLTAPANASSSQFLVGSLSSSVANIPGWSSGNVAVNTIINVPVAGTYQLNAKVRVGAMTGNSTSKYRFSFMRQANGSSTWTDQEFFGLGLTGGGVGSDINELWIPGFMPISLGAGDAVRLGVLTSVSTGTVNITGCRFWLTRIS